MPVELHSLAGQTQRRSSDLYVIAPHEHATVIYGVKELTHLGIVGQHLRPHPDNFDLTSLPCVSSPRAVGITSGLISSPIFPLLQPETTRHWCWSTHFIPAEKPFTALDTVELLADRLTRYLAFPEALISARDPRFQSEVWQRLCTLFNIKRTLSSSYHPRETTKTNE